MSSEGRIVLVTGCSKGGIGYALCEGLLKRGCVVYATSRRLESMKDLVTVAEDGSHHGTVHLKELDVCNEDMVQRVVKEVIEEAGVIDIVISNAGILDAGPILDIPLARVQQTFDTNTFGTLRLARAVIPHMASRQQGLFAIIGSVGGFTSTPWTGVYGASKFALHAIANSLDMECKPFGIKVSLIAPAGVTSQVANNASARFEFPEGSLYRDYSEAIISRMWASQTKYASSTTEFAQRTVDALLRPNPPRFMSIGGGSWMFYFFSWMPRWYALDALWSKFGKRNDEFKKVA